MVPCIQQVRRPSISIENQLSWRVETTAVAMGSPVSGSVARTSDR
jgi:hypothetical protein